MGAPASPAAVVESIDDEESDRWKAMADAFDFGGLSDDDDDGHRGHRDRGETRDARNDSTRLGDDDAYAPSTPQRRGRTAGASRLLPVRWLESRGVGSVDGADRGFFPGVDADRRPTEGAADKIDAGAEANEELAARFAREYRSIQPFLTRRVAETWMTRSALGRRGARGALEAGQAGDAGASEPVKTTLLFSRDNSNFLGRGGMCDRTDDVPFREAWSHVAAHAAGRTDRRCYFRAPLAVELRRGIDFTAASVVFGGEGEAETNAKAKAKAAETDESNAPPPRSPSARPPCGCPVPGASRRSTSTCATGC